MWLYDRFVYVSVHRTLMATETKQPLVGVNNAIMVGHSRLMTADWG